MARNDKDFLDLEVVDLERAEVIGGVDGLIVDEATKAVAGLVVDLGIYEAKAIRYGDVVSVGEDAVTVESTQAVKPISEQPDLEEIAGRGVTVCDEIAITDGGDIAGVTGDFYVDTDSGEIRAIEILVPEENGESIYTVPISNVVRIGADIVMIQAGFVAQSVGSGEDL